MKNTVVTMFLLGTLLNVSAQVPSYVTTNGLVSAYTFTGNANNVFGNGSNGVVSNAILTTDRFGIVNNAYEFNGTNSSINLGINQGINSIVTDFTISYWVYKTNNLFGNVVSSYSNQSGSYWRFNMNIAGDSVSSGFLVGGGLGNWQGSKTKSNSLNLNNWINVTIIRNGPNFHTYINGILSNSSSVSSSSLNNPTSPAATTKIGYTFPSNEFFFKGKIDDLYFWNRALSTSEMKDLFVGCLKMFNNEPNNQASIIDSQVQFTVVGKDTNASYQWQSNHANMGWSNVPSNSYYSGVTSKKLMVNNIKLKNHEQLFRVIAIKNTCKDTSIVAMLTINDTCITSTTDTLYIKVNTSSLGNPNYNTFKVYPNPSSTQVVIDNGDFSIMGSYTAKIINSKGQQVFQSTINQQKFVIEANTMGGAGVYTLYMTDSNNKVVGVKKIVLQ